MKRIVLIFLCVCFVCSIGGCSKQNNKIVEMTDTVSDDNLKGIWISYSELSCGENTSETEYKEKIDEMFENVSNFGFNCVFVHVRAFSDAFYKSNYFPSSSYLGVKQGVEPNFDALQIMVETAKEKKLKLHAWINPYRISFKTDIANLSENNPARIWLEKNVYDKKILTATGLYYNPASEEVRTLIINGIKEIVENYDVNGIHFDDYFYPQTDLFIDSDYYKSYLENYGKLSQEDWRMHNVNTLIKQVYEEIKKIDEDVIFGISPSGNLENNEKELFADVKTWVSENGYVDYLCPQLYYGFNNSICPFSQTAQVWADLATNENVKLYAGLGFYKYTESDSGEWYTDTNIIFRQIQHINSLGRYSGVVMFSYSYVFPEIPEEKITKELKLITNLFKI